MDLLEHADRSLVDAACGAAAAGWACLDQDNAELDALAAAIAAGAATAAREFALALWRRTACSAVLAAGVLAAMVLILILMQ